MSIRNLANSSIFFCPTSMNVDKLGSRKPCDVQPCIGTWREEPPKCRFFAKIKKKRALCNRPIPATIHTRPQILFALMNEYQRRLHC